ncbi:DMT family transporter [Pseudooceanicola sp. 502str34]|uniref:DMT family transporter n=1 Tax=Maritimibacter alkaliphilus TaxID=404236 RepID=UPI001C9576A0|nr:DMT family transporter [Maritimibacter alkaliphilus]MBY6092484.1 DMT family transporter [Maritimibacter alkaliphilus]
MQPLRGILLKIGAVLCFIGMSTMIKLTSDRIPAGEQVFFRSVCALPVILAWIALKGQLRSGLKVKSPAAHFWRGLVGTTAMGCGFAALAFLPLPEQTALGYATPLLVVVFAAMFLNEKVGIFRISTVLVGLVGVMVVMVPQLTLSPEEAMNSAAPLGVLLVLFGAVCAALAQIHIRNMVRVEQTSAIVFWFSSTATLLSLATIPFGWVLPSGWEWVFLISTGLIGGVGQIMLTSSYRFADASVVAPFDYASMLFAILIGYTVFGDVPTLQTLVGAAIIICAGVVIILRERHLGLLRGQAREAKTPHG